MGGGGASSKPVYSTSGNRAGSVAAPVVNTPVSMSVTPATARNIGQDTANAVKNQQQARSRLQGIRSTWAAFGERSGAKSKTLG